VDHENAFANNADVEPSLLCEYMDADFRLAVQSLGIEGLRTGLSALLSEEQIVAILARRDLVMKQCNATGKAQKIGGVALRAEQVP